MNSEFPLKKKLITCEIILIGPKLNLVPLNEANNGKALNYRMLIKLLPTRALALLPSYSAKKCANQRD